MKQSGRNIKRRLTLTLLGNRISRIKHFRGHGVHSPFVYNLVRKVFMHKQLPIGKPNSLYYALIERDVPQRRAVELQNMLYFCSADGFSIDNAPNLEQMHIITATLPISEYRALYAKAVECGTTLVILSPYLNREHRAACTELLMRHGSTSVDNRGYIIFFNNHLPKQHYKL